METSPVVLLHGFWHASWCWAVVVEGLASRRRVVAPVDMAAHGLAARHPASVRTRPLDHRAFAAELSPVGSVTLAAAADRLVSQLERIGGGRPCVLVAHSMGGTVATAAVQRAPHLVAHVVYLAAFMPASGAPAGAYRVVPENAGELVGPRLCADPPTVGALRIDPQSPDAAYRAGLRDAFYNDVEDDVAEAAIALLSYDAPFGIASGATNLTGEGWGAVPRTYVLCTRDNAIRPALQRRFIAEADAAFPGRPTRVVELEASHSPFLSVPDRVVEVIDAVA
jgi:pimeloyl-ACP methyl ester carboxylesterase